jgi:hypothetical protein
MPNGTFDSNIVGWVQIEGGALINSIWTNTHYHNAPGCFKINVYEIPLYNLNLSPSISKVSFSVWVKLDILEDADLAIFFGVPFGDWESHVHHFTSSDWEHVEFEFNNNHGQSNLVFSPPYVWEQDFIYIDEIEIYDIS